MADTYFDEDDLTFQWDDEKEKINIEKHGIDFATASHVFNDISVLNGRICVIVHPKTVISQLVW